MAEAGGVGKKKRKKYQRVVVLFGVSFFALVFFFLLLPPPLPRFSPSSTSDVFCLSSLSLSLHPLPLSLLPLSPSPCIFPPPPPHPLHCSFFLLRRMRGMFVENERIQTRDVGWLWWGGTWDARLWVAWWWWWVGGKRREAVEALNGRRGWQKKGGRREGGRSEGKWRRKGWSVVGIHRLRTSFTTHCLSPPLPLPPGSVIAPFLVQPFLPSFPPSPPFPTTPLPSSSSCALTTPPPHPTPFPLRPSQRLLLFARPVGGARCTLCGEDKTKKTKTKYTVLTYTHTHARSHTTQPRTYRTATHTTHRIVLYTILCQKNCPRTKQASKVNSPPHLPPYTLPTLPSPPNPPHTKYPRNH